MTYNSCGPYEAALHGKFGQGSAAYAPCGFPAHWQAIYRARCAKEGRAACEIIHVQLAELRRPAFWLDFGSEDTADAANSAEDLHAQRKYGPLPLIVLTAANDDGGPSPLPPAEMKAVERAVQRGHDRLAHLSTIGVNSIVHHSGHDIQAKRPSTVIAAIAEVLEQARHILTHASALSGRAESALWVRDAPASTADCM